MSELPLRSRRANDTAGIYSLPAGGRVSGEVEIEHEREPISSRVRSSSLTGLHTPLLKTPYGTLTWDATHSIAWYVRSSVGYASLEDIEHESFEIERALQKAGKIRLLVDLRAATPRNDPEFETAIVKFRRKLFGGGQQVAVLVRTAMGALQVKRHVREDGFAVEVFTNESMAIAHLAQRPSDRGLRAADGPASRPGLKPVLRRVG
jgi:hypothetical protein